MLCYLKVCHVNIIYYIYNIQHNIIRHVIMSPNVMLVVVMSSHNMYAKLMVNGV